MWEEEFTLTVEEDHAEVNSRLPHRQSLRALSEHPPPRTARQLELVVFNFDNGGHQFVGSTLLRLSEIESGEPFDEWLPLTLRNCLPRTEPPLPPRKFRNPYRQI